MNKECVVLALRGCPTLHYSARWWLSFRPLKSTTSSIHLYKALWPETPSICTSVGVGLPCIHLGIDTRFTAYIQIIQTERHCVSQATVLAPLRTRSHPPLRPRLSRRSPMADEAEIASVISLIQGMYINNVSVIIFFSNLQCPISANNNRLIPLFLFLARHECARPCDRRLGDRIG